ncbi:hypothetical protein AN217_09065 [Streptomyces qinglanensis]|uniref:DUF732 domain-containing protein n=1 Tax=Streptomyces qinglanensis TaxID=943816 RepID=A0A1E7K278_9ACTN|nr:hypothetical protein [Streptomyces qinglanensis]OEU97966.1 hypothetical protein AN217_09065 [Streptomyces qinglanensis]OEV24694.1 hypothetical protein AN220_17775 [Streptomyces nanshensis]
MSARRAAPAAAALVAAVLVLTAGCGAGGDDGGEAAKRPRAEKSAGAGEDASAAPEDEPAPGDGREGRPEDPKDTQDPEEPGDEDVPKVPRASLSPATGSFTEKEKEYLVGRVPQGLEPAAVLEAGRTACARLRSTAEASRKDAISALKAGEIDNAGPAVHHLCPRFEPLLEAAGRK